MILFKKNNDSGLKVKIEDITYSINQDNKTASISLCQPTSEDIYIPRSIIYESEEYIITRILKRSFDYLENIKSIQFAENSEVRTIEKNVFVNSTIESISFPSSIVDLQDGWCNEAIDLVNITIHPDNPRYKTYEDCFIIGKSTTDKEYYDVLVFCARDIFNVKIPNFIEIIAPYAFNFCDKMNNFEFDPDSKLRIIGHDAFTQSTISSIKIPSHVQIIENKAFHSCEKLQQIEIPSNSELQIIGEFAFSSTKLNSLFIPSKLNELRNGWCTNTPDFNYIKLHPKNQNYILYNEKFILGKSSPENETFNILLFSVRNITKVFIPSFIEIIESYAFNSCEKIEQFEISNESKLNNIKELAFSSCSIKKLTFPSKITKISELTFSFCKNLNEIDCLNSNLKYIERKAFANSTIKSISIPSSIVELKDGWCLSTPFLTNVKIMPNKNYITYDNNLIISKSSPQKDIYDVLNFCPRNIKTIKIPSFIEIIGNYAFNNCKNLYDVEIPEDSKLRIIGSDAFAQTSLRKFTVPSCLTVINDLAFYYCCLEKFEIPENSNLQKINRSAFLFTLIKSLFIPKSIELTDENFLFSFKNVQIIEFDENLQFEIVNNNIFHCCNNLTIMIPLKLSEMFQAKFM